jgi:hypothetical protein
VIACANCAKSAELLCRSAEAVRSAIGLYAALQVDTALEVALLEDIKSHVKRLEESK